MSMTSKERVQAALDFRQPDHVPCGFYAIDCSENTFSCALVRSLRMKTLWWAIRLVIHVST